MPYYPLSKMRKRTFGFKRPFAKEIRRERKGNFKCVLLRFLYHFGWSESTQAYHKIDKQFRDGLERNVSQYTLLLV